jgi:diacylglycerol diphosphate phosphatase / phosphatidate phosphatase
MYITQEILDEVKYPFVESTVPSWTVPLYSLGVPPAVILGHGIAAKRPASLSHNAVLSSFFSTGLTALVTNIFKITVRFLSPRQCNELPLSSCAKI